MENRELTDEEKAMVYTAHNSRLGLNEILSRPEVIAEIRKAYIAGLKEERKKIEIIRNRWHDLRHTPFDTPNNNKQLAVCYLTANNIKNYFYNVFYDNKFYFLNSNGEDVEIENVIAWCDLPRFK